jgi:hypothetical protein
MLVMLGAGITCWYPALHKVNAIGGWLIHARVSSAGGLASFREIGIERSYSGVGGARVRGKDIHTLCMIHVHTYMQ